MYLRSKNGKNVSVPQRLLNTLFYKNNLVLPAGTIFNSWVNEVSIFSSQPLDFKRDHTFSRFLVVFLCPV